MLYAAPAGGTIDTGKTQPVRQRAGAVVDRRELDLGERGRATPALPRRRSICARRSRSTIRRRSQRAVLRVNVDDNHVTYVNGVQVATMGNSFQTSAIADIKSQLVAGHERDRDPGRQRLRRPGGRAGEARPRRHARSSPTRPGRRARANRPAGTRRASMTRLVERVRERRVPAPGRGARSATRTPAARARTRRTTLDRRDGRRGHDDPRRRHARTSSPGTKLDVGGETARVASVAGHHGHARDAARARRTPPGDSVWQANSAAPRRLPLPDDLPIPARAR